MLAIDAASRRLKQQRRERIVHAYQTANLQGAPRRKLQELLDLIDAEPGQTRERKPASPEHLMTVMAQWRVAMAEVAIQGGRKPPKPAARRR